MPIITGDTWIRRELCFNKGWTVTDCSTPQRYREIHLPGKASKSWTSLVQCFAVTMINNKLDRSNNQWNFKSLKFCIVYMKQFTHLLGIKVSPYLLHGCQVVQ